MRLPEQLHRRPGAPARPGRAPDSTTGAPGTCAGGSGRPAPSGRGPGEGGTCGWRVGGDAEVWVGQLRREAPARPGWAVCAAGHSLMSRSRRSIAQESRAPFSPRSLPTEAAGWRCPVDRGSGRIRAEEGCHGAGAEPQPLHRTGHSSCPAPGSLGWPSTASPCRSRPQAIGGKALCRAAQAGEGSRPWAPAGRGRLQPRPPTRAAVALLARLQPPSHRKEQREKIKW